MDNYWLNALWSIIPTVLVGVIFWFVMRAIIRADRDERAAYADLEAAERSRLGLPPAPTKATDGSVEN
jgi:flagellar biosynthesis/type III secretory pathway M-ring protein FliF/YscJ